MILFGGLSFMTFNTKKIKITIKGDLDDTDLTKTLENVDKTLNKTFENFDKSMDNAFNGFDTAFKNFDKVFDNVEIKIKTKTKELKRPEWPKGPERWEESDIPRPPKPRPTGIRCIKEGDSIPNKPTPPPPPPPPPKRIIREPSNKCIDAVAAQILKIYRKIKSGVVCVREPSIEDMFNNGIDVAATQIVKIYRKIKSGIVYVIDYTFRKK